jgi:hypothetical protein
MSSPSIIPNDRLDRDFYIVLAAAQPSGKPTRDYPTLIPDLPSGQYRQPLRIVAFNPAEGWCATPPRTSPASSSDTPAMATGRFPMCCRIHRGPAWPQDRRAVAAAVADLIPASS